MESKWGGQERSNLKNAGAVTLDLNFQTAGMYAHSRTDLDLEKSGVDLKKAIERQYDNQALITLFQDGEAKFMLTETGVILSIEVPHAMGDHLEMAVNYESIEVNMLKSSPVWKDYSFLAK